MMIIVVFRNFAKESKKDMYVHIRVYIYKSPDCLPDGSGRHIRIDRTVSAASCPVTNCHECARLSNLEKRRQEEARAHIGLLSHGYYYILILIRATQYLYKRAGLVFLCSE
jgi:hypothetical protein